MLLKFKYGLEKYWYYAKYILVTDFVELIVKNVLLFKRILQNPTKKLKSKYLLQVVKQYTTQIILVLAVSPSSNTVLRLGMLSEETILSSISGTLVRFR